MSLHLKSWLFVPGDRPDRFDKAATSGADAIILDLEDAVAPPRKAGARKAVVDWLMNGEKRPAQVMVRINPIDGQDGMDDLLAIAAQSVCAIVLPKVESAATVITAERLLSGAGSPAALVAQIESARGVSAVEPIAESCERLGGLAFGGADYAADLGVEVVGCGAEYARARLVNAAALRQIAAIDTPSFDIAAPDALVADCAASKALGFHGKLAIHPSQVATINAAFQPSAAQIARARRMLDAFNDGVAMVDGKMIDIALIRWARRIVDAGT